jgi:SAM-dependent methyltransferase
MYNSDFWNDIYNNCLTNEKEVPWEQSDVVNKNKEIISDILSPLSQREKTLLDYGCGIGTYIDLFIEKNYKVTIIDISSIAIDKCKELYKEKISLSLIQDSPDNINNKYDVVICWGVMHHIDPKNWNKFIEKFYKLLNDSGILIISGWDKENDRFINHNGISNNTHLKTWAINGIEKELKHYFIVEKNETFNFNIKTGDNNFRYYVCKKKDEEKCSLDNLKRCIREQIEKHSISFAEIIYYDVKDNIEYASYNENKSFVLYNSESEMMEIFSEINVSTEEYGKLKAFMKKVVLTEIKDLMKEKPLEDIIENILPEKISLTEMMYRRPDKKNVFFYSSKTVLEKEPKIENYRENTTLKIEISYPPKGNKPKSDEKTFKENLNLVMKSLKKNENSKPQKPKGEMTLKEKFDLVDEVGKNEEIKKELVKRYYDKATIFLNENELGYSEEQFRFFYHIFYQENMYFYYFINPMFTTNNSIVGDGGLILYCKNPLLEMEIDKIELLFTKWSSVLSAKTYSDKFIQKSTLSAKSAIMARNLSHNLGSHVMAYLKQYLKSVEDVVAKGALEELLITPNRELLIDANLKEWKAKISEHIKQDKDIEFPFLVGLGRFISYVQERQDFIATICTDYIPYYSTVNFKDFIYDELNPDCHSIRHFDVKGIKTDNILLKFIAQSEGLTRDYEKDGEGKRREFADNNVIIKFREFNGINVNINAENKESEEYTEECRNLDEMRKFEFSLPGGIVGRQAFFSIIENIIRNAAKHGDRGDNKSLELIIDVLEKDNLPDLYIITITDNTIKNDGVVKKIREALEEKYIDEQGKLLEANKGIKEMRISTCYLRGIDVTKEDEYQSLKNEKTPILQINNDNNDGNLQYVFYVPKPKKIAFIVDSFNEQSQNECNNNLQEYHCRIFTVEQFKEENRKNYEFIVVQDSTEEKSVYNKILPFSHSRIVTYDFAEKLRTNFDYFKVEPKEDKFEKVNEYLCELWRKSFENENELQNITIIDKGMNTSNSENINIYQDDDSALDAKAVSNFIYRYHHNSKKEYEKFLDTYSEDFINEIKFIETITGSNSTDRLIRHEKLDNLWYYKHLSAMQTRIAIIDERLFTKITGIKQTELSSSKEKKTENNTSLFFKKKNIDFYTFVYNESLCNFELWGEDLQNENCNSNLTYKNIAQIDKALKLEFGINEKYDFIAIHQGLLDKIYKKFNVKDDCDKRKITETFFDKFSKKTKIEYNDNGKKVYFLPGFLIHSGRSKPSESDMPQKQPFIQFSALENAVSDCKYSLVELLTHAHYEQQK